MIEADLYKFQNLPLDVKKILFMDESLAANEKIIEKFNLEEKKEEFFRIIREVTLKEIKLDQLLNILKKKLDLNEEEARQLAIELTGYRFLPLQFYLGDVESYIRKWGGDLRPYLDHLEKMFSPANQLKDLLNSALEKFNLTDFDEEKRRRLVNIIFSQAGGLRNKERTQNVLIQSYSQGGLGLEVEKAKALADEIERIISEEELTKEKIEKIRAKKEQVLKYEKEIIEKLKIEETKKEPIRETERLTSSVPEPASKGLTPLEKKVLEEEEKNDKIEIDSSDL